MRPYGEITLAIERAAAQGPAPARELCKRAQVAWGVGAVTCTRMKERGQLVKLGGRGAPLALPDAAALAEPPSAAMAAMVELQARFWRGSQTQATEQAPDFSCL